MIKIEVIPFMGYPIARVNLDTFVDRDTIKFIKDLSYIKHIKHSESGLKLSKDAHILQNKECKILFNDF